VPLFAVHYHASRVEGHAGHISADANRFVGSPFSVHVLPDFTILHELCMPIVHSRDERSRLLRSAFERSLSVYSPPPRGFRSFELAFVSDRSSLTRHVIKKLSQERYLCAMEGWYQGREGDSKERGMRRRIEEGAPGTKIRFDIRLGPLFKIMKHN